MSPTLPHSLTFNNLSLDTIQKHSKKFKCEFANCDRSFSTSGHLSRHVKIHTGDRPHECLIQGCARRFTRKDSMMLHFSTHRKNLENSNQIVMLKNIPKSLRGGRRRSGPTSLPDVPVTEINSSPALSIHSSFSTPEITNRRFSNTIVANQFDNFFSSLESTKPSSESVLPSPQTHFSTKAKTQCRNMEAYPMYDMEELVKPLDVPYILTPGITPNTSPNSTITDSSPNNMLYYQLPYF